MRYTGIVAIAALTVLTACGGKVYDTYRHTSVEGWERNDTLCYDVNKVHSQGNYVVELGVRTAYSYPFVALTLIVDQTILPSGTTLTDTINCKLVTPPHSQKTGGISIFQYNTTVRELKLNAKDSLHITVRHDMKRDILPGISDVGISVKAIR